MPWMPSGRLDLTPDPGEPRGMTSTASPESLEQTILSIAAARGPDKTLCPSDVARALGGPHPDGWGPLMQPIRRVAVRMAKEGRLVITRRGKAVDPDDFRGVYRLGLPRDD
jgi:Protein of unknown function (DUF3253)